MTEEIDEYDFAELLDAALEKAQEEKSKEPKSDKTRYWAVVFTDLEKIIAYVDAYLLEGDTDDF